MIKFNYYEALKQMKNVYGVRKYLVKCASAFGISAAAREYSTTRKTVRKWLYRYNRYGLKGLEVLTLFLFTGNLIHYRDII